MTGNLFAKARVTLAPDEWAVIVLPNDQEVIINANGKISMAQWDVGANIDLQHTWNEPVTVTEEEPVTFTRDQVLNAANRALDDIDAAAKLPDTGIKDALNLMRSATLSYLDDSSTDLAGVAEKFEIDDVELGDRTHLSVILDWIYS